MFPGFYMNHGFTTEMTLSYGAPGSLFTEQEPLLAGCAPKVGLTSTGESIAKIYFEYSELSPKNIPLIKAAVSNTSDVGSYNITYEAQLPGFTLPIRIKTFHEFYSTATDASKERNGTVGDFHYDTQGRLTLINWTYTGSGSASARLRSKRAPGKSDQIIKWPARFIPTPSRPRSFDESPVNHGHYKYRYEDPLHPHLPTYYESLDQDGFGAIKWRWGTNDNGLVVNVRTDSYEKGTCSQTCPSGSTCCKDVGTSSAGACYAVADCDQVGGSTWHYGYDEHGRALYMNQSGTMQNYTYDESGRLTAYVQNNLTLYKAVYENGRAAQQLFWVIYPYFPEVWAYDPPSASPAEVFI